MRGLRQLCLAVLGGVFVCSVCVGVEDGTVRLRLSDEKVRIQPGGEIEADISTGTMEQEFVPDDDQQQGKRINFSFSNRINHDSNPLVVATGEDEDWADVLNLSVGGKFLTRGLHEVGGQYSFYGEFYQELDGRDIAGHIVDIYYSWMGDPVTLRVDYMYSHFLLDDEPYMHKHTLAPMLLYISGKLSMEMARLAVSSNSYPDVATLDGTDWTFQLTHFRFLDEARKKRLSLGYKYSNNDADDNNQGYKADEINAGVQWPLIWQLKAVVDFAWSRKVYGSNRGDEKIDYGLEISRPINKMWSAALGYESINNDSGDAISEYERNITYFLVSAAF